MGRKPPVAMTHSSPSQLLTWQHSKRECLSQKIQDRVHKLGENPLVNLDINLEPAGDAIGHRSLRQLEEDLDRAKLLGMNAYRFSIEWARVEPRPRQFDDDALAYYDAAIDDLAHGV